MSDPLRYRPGEPRGRDGDILLRCLQPHEHGPRLSERELTRDALHFGLAEFGRSLAPYVNALQRAAVALARLSAELAARRRRRRSA